MYGMAPSSLQRTRHSAEWVAPYVLYFHIKLYLFGIEKETTTPMGCMGQKLNTACQ